MIDLYNYAENFFGGEGWTSYHDEKSIGGKFEKRTGLSFGGSTGFGTKSFSVEFGLSSGLRLVLDVKRMRKNLKLRVISSYPVNGLPFENNNAIEFDAISVDDEKSLGKQIMLLATAIKKGKRGIVKRLAKDADKNDRQKSMYMLSM